MRWDRRHLGCVFGFTLYAALATLNSGHTQESKARAQAAVPSSAEKDPDITQAEETLVTAGLATDGPALLEFFRQRARLEGDWDKLSALTRQLADASIEVRGRTATALVARGPIAIPLLRQAVNDLDDPDVAARARQCLRLIEGPEGAAVPAAAARLLATRKPPGAAKVLLAYLPFADDPAVSEQVGKALAAVAYAAGKADPALLHALEDALPVRRACAGEALCRKDHPEQFPAVRKLLNDAKPAVRLRAALALAKEQDVEAIPVLIDLIAELPAPQRKQIEEVLQELAGEWAPTLALAGDDDVSRRIRRDAWAGWWNRTDGPTLLAEFGKRTMSPAGLAKIQGLIKKLGDDSFQVREQATADLVAYGAMVAPLLREAAKDGELERRTRAANCLRAIAKSETRSLPTAAARLMALRKPAGAVEALLAFLPWTEDEPLIAEVQTALAVLAVRDGKVEPALLRALEDALPMRRTAAGLALAKAAPEHRPAARKLLRDTDPAVRIRVALALAGAKEKEAVPVLIDALADVAREHSDPALEALYVLAGDKAPEAASGDDAAARKKHRDAWAVWWKANSATADLAKLTAVQGTLGYTLLVGVTQNQQMGHVTEIGRDGKPRWRIDGLQTPFDARMIGGTRVLIVEFQGMRVSERDLKGKVIWQTQGVPNNPITAQRLSNGNTFITTQMEVIEVDRTGKQVFRRNFQNWSLSAAHKFPNGDILYLAQHGVCGRVDAKGNEIKRFQTQAGSMIGAMDVSPNGRILLAHNNQNMIMEVDADGKMLLQLNVPEARTASWMPNGHILAAGYNSRRVAELDRTGKVVWEHRDNNHYYRARRR